MAPILSRLVEAEEEALPPTPLPLRTLAPRHARRLADPAEAALVVAVVRVQDSLGEVPVDPVLRAAARPRLDLGLGRLAVRSPLDQRDAAGAQDAPHLPDGPRLLL